MKLTTTQNPEVFRVTYKGRTRTFEWTDLMYWLEDVDQTKFSETVMEEER